MVKNEDVKIMTYKGIEIDGKPTLELLKSIFAGDFTSATAIGCYEYWESKNWLTKKGAELKTLETAISVYKSVANKKLQKEEKKRRNRIEFLEKEIGKLEARMKEIETVLSAPKDGDDIMELTRAYLECKRDLDAKTEEWGELID